jgi:DNA-binding transcriptional LysR family regulator
MGWEMNTVFFKYAVEIERTRSITKAAENLYMAQPNLSKAIKEAEDAFGFSIFERNSRGVIPTRKGMEFLAHARTILEQVEKIRRLSDSGGEEQRYFSVSFPRCSYIAAGFNAFARELDFEKDIIINIQETNSMQAIANILENKYNLGIIRYQTVYENYFLDYLSDKNLNYDLIWEFEYLALMSKDHCLAGEKDFTINKLRDYVEIVHGDTIVPYLNAADMRQYVPDSGHKRIYLYERWNQFELLTTIPSTYMWASPIPGQLLARYNLIQRKCLFANNRYKDMLVYPKRYSFSPLDKKFIDKLYEAKNEVSFQEYR